MRILFIAQICCVVIGISSSANLFNLQMSRAAGDCLRGVQNQRVRPDTFPKFDEYGDLPFAKEKERLDYFAQELTSVPQEPGYIIEYRSRRQKRKPLARANRAKTYLVRVKGIDAKRIQVVNGGYRREFKIELRLGPAPLR